MVKVGFIRSVLIPSILILILGLVFSDKIYATNLGISTSGEINILIDTGGNVGISTLNVKTDCRFGYTISIASSVNDTKLYKNGDNTSQDFISPVNGTSENPKPILTPGGAPNTTWGYSMTAKDIKGSFIGLTSSQTKLFQKNSASSDSGDDILVYYGASAIYEMPAGTYKMAGDGAVVYYLTTNQPNCDVYKIVYDGNNADADFNTSLSHDGKMRDDSFSLYASNYKRFGYGFAGWSTTQIDPDAADASEQIANATIYGPEETITIDDSIINAADSNDIITLYAVWVKSEGNFQDFDRCDVMEIGEVTALKDARDGDVYAIAKLKDGKCWMIENFRLGEDVPMDLTESDSNMSGSFTLPASSQTFDTNNNTTAWLNIENKKSAQAMISTVNDLSGRVYSYGTYYSWPAAIANTEEHEAGQDVPTSVCPKGWRLPAGGAGREFSVLDKALGGNGLRQNTIAASNRWREFPNNFIYSGGWWKTSAVNRNIYGYYSSSTAYSTQRAYYLWLAGNFVVPDSDESDMQYVTTVRCVTSHVYEVIYHANGGGGMMPRQYVQIGEVFTIEENGFTPPTNRKFIGWNTRADGNGIDYKPGDTVMNLVDGNGAGAIVLYAQWEKTPTPGYVIYDGNKNTSSFETDSQQVNGNSIILLAPNYERIGYGFAGWSTEKLDSDAADFTTRFAEIVAAGKIYGPNQTVASTEVSGKTLFAVWMPSAGALQDWNGCAAMEAGDTIALTDTRDGNSERVGNTYAVVKLADDHCWMVENLRLGSDISMALTSDDTAIANDFTLPASTPTFSTSDTTTAWVNASDTLTPLANTTSINQLSFAYGSYYSWPAAIADTALHTSEEVVATSICPKGWHLPSGGIGGELSVLDVSLGGSGVNQSTADSSNRYRDYPNNFTLGGGWGSSGSVNRGTYGYYATATSHSSGRAYYFYLQHAAVLFDNTQVTNLYVTMARCLANY